LHHSGAISPWQFNAYLTAILNAASATAHSAGKRFAQPLNAGTSKNIIFLKQRLLDDRKVDVGRAFKVACEAINRNAANQCGHRSITASAEAFAQSSKEKCDLYYLDPPYTAQQYSRFYHVLETIVTYKYPQLLHNGRVTAGLYPTDRYKSAFSSKTNARLAIRKIIQSAKRQDAAMLISYSDSSKQSDGNSRMISLHSLLSECKDAYGKGVEWGQLSHRYRQFNSSLSSNEYRNDREILIKCRTI
jgi:adenine-specific DNA methylase